MDSHRVLTTTRECHLQISACQGCRILGCQVSKKRTWRNSQKIAPFIGLNLIIECYRFVRRNDLGEARTPDLTLRRGAPYPSRPRDHSGGEVSRHLSVHNNNSGAQPSVSVLRLQERLMSHFGGFVRQYFAVVRRCGPTETRLLPSYRFGCPSESKASRRIPVFRCIGLPTLM